MRLRHFDLEFARLPGEVMAAMLLHFQEAVRQELDRAIVDAPFNQLVVTPRDQARWPEPWEVAPVRGLLSTGEVYFPVSGELARLSESVRRHWLAEQACEGAYRLAQKCAWNDVERFTAIVREIGRREVGCRYEFPKLSKRDRHRGVTVLAIGSVDEEASSVIARVTGDDGQGLGEYTLLSTTRPVPLAFLLPASAVIRDGKYIVRDDERTSWAQLDLDSKEVQVLVTGDPTTRSSRKTMTSPNSRP